MDAKAPGLFTVFSTAKCNSSKKEELISDPTTFHESEQAAGTLCGHTSRL